MFYKTDTKYLNFSHCLPNISQKLSPNDLVFSNKHVKITKTDKLRQGISLQLSRAKLLEIANIKRRLNFARENYNFIMANVLFLAGLVSHILKY